jgi:hypothetical protein
MFRRKSKDSAEASAEGGQTAAPAADAAGKPVTDGETESADTRAESAGEAAATTSADAGAEVSGSATQDPEIPGQPSAEKTADNEVGETARK